MIQLYSASVVSTLLLLEGLLLCHGTSVVYIPPTEPSRSSCPSDHGFCFTVNEWIENGTHPFTNSTTVVLQSGTHFINSTFHFLLVHQVSSIVLTGHPYEKTTIECNHGSRFGFKFYDVEEVNISNVQFKYCAVLYKDVPYPDYYVTSFNFTLAFVKSRNITVENTEIISAGVFAAIHSKQESAFRIDDSVLTSGLLFDAECTLIMERTTIQNVTGYEFNLFIFSALKVSFTDIVVRNNSAPLTIENVKHIEFKGLILFSWNSGEAGVLFYNCLRLHIHSDTTIELSNNIVGKNLLHIINRRDRYVAEGDEDTSGDKSKVIAFINNTATNGGIMILDVANVDPMLLSNTELVFKNNTCHNPENSQAAVLLLMETFLLVDQSNATFVHNRSPLSGGLTLKIKQAYHPRH